jgi:prenyltransferase beta subunit
MQEILLLGSLDKTMKIKTIIIALLLLTLNIYPAKIFADMNIDNAVNYLKAKQDTTGQITGGSTGDASSWAAIAFSANGIDIVTVKSENNSLNDYLLHNHPTNSSAATEWEKWILAITASGQNPYSFGGVNYVTTLESSTYYNSKQIGDTSSVTDDWFGVLALISSGVDKADPVLTNSLSFILSHQNSDGGFGYSTTAGSDGNDTAAAIQALVAAKNYGVANTNLDSAIINAKIYLLSTQDKSGGFLYDTSTYTTAPDSDSTTWAIMALNVLGMQSSSQANSAKTWLLSQQANDGGFQACQYNPPDYACTLVSNSTTTSHALIGLAGKNWIIKIFDASTITPAPTTSITPTTTPSPIVTGTSIPTPTPTASSQSSSSSPTATPTPTPAAIPTATPTQTSQALANVIDTPTDPPILSPTAAPKVLGVKTSNDPSTLTQAAHQDSPMPSFLAKLFLVLGIIFAGLYGVRFYRLRMKNPRNE